MNIFIDTEFTDAINTDLISIGLVSEDGREFYGEREDFDSSLCSDFVRAAILPTLRASGASVLLRKQLVSEVTTWLTQFKDVQPTICYDNMSDWTLLFDLYDNDPPTWLGQGNIRDNLDLITRAKFFAETGLLRHHALNDAKANAAAYRPQ